MLPARIVSERPFVCRAAVPGGSTLATDLQLLCLFEPMSGVRLETQSEFELQVESLESHRVEGCSFGALPHREMRETLSFFAFVKQMRDQITESPEHVWM